MAIFASTTVPYSAPTDAFNIKALEARQKDMLAQIAQSNAITPENTQTPVQGFGHLANILGDRVQANRADARIAEQKAQLAQLMSGYDPSAPDAMSKLGNIGRYDPTLQAELLKQRYESGEKKLDRTQSAEQAAAADRRMREMQAEQIKSTEGQGALTRQQQLDLATQEQKARADLAGAERNVRVAEAALDRASKTGDQREMIAATAALEEAKAGHAMARQKSSEAATAVEGDKGRAATATNLQTQIGSTEKLAKAKQDFDAAQAELKRASDTGDQQMIIAAKEKAAAAQQAHEKELANVNNTAKAALPQSPRGAIEHDIKQTTIPPDQVEAARRGDPAQAAKQAENVRAAEVEYRKGLTHIQNLEEATKILEHPNGIYTGAMQNVAPGVSGVPGLNMFVDKEKAQRTSRFNTIVGEDAIRDMATTLKGSSTNYEMNEFKKMKNDPNISDQQRAAQLRRVVAAARSDLESQAKETKALGGDTARIDRDIGGGGSAAKDPNAEARAWLADPANANSPHRAGVMKRLEGK